MIISLMEKIVHAQLDTMIIILRLVCFVIILVEAASMEIRILIAQAVQLMQIESLMFPA